MFHFFFLLNCDILSPFRSSSKADNNATVLVLNGYNGWKPVMLINSEGQQEELACFERDDNTEAFNSCSLTWRNQLHVFGGDTERRQISRLTGYKLERIGDLPFDHYVAACSVMANQYIYLCFDWNTPKQCRRSTGPLETFSKLAMSNHDHVRAPTSCSDSKSE